MSRKMTLIAGVVFLNGSSKELQAWWCMVVVSVFLFVHTTNHPYEDQAVRGRLDPTTGFSALQFTPFLDRFETFSLACSFLIYTGGLLLSFPDLQAADLTDSHWGLRTALSILIALVIFTWALGCSAAAIRSLFASLETVAEGKYGKRFPVLKRTARLLQRKIFREYTSRDYAMHAGHDVKINSGGEARPNLPERMSRYSVKTPINGVKALATGDTRDSVKAVPLDPSLGRLRVVIENLCSFRHDVD